MKKEEVARSVIKATLSTAIKSIEKDPKRATRDLVGKGRAFSSSRFQSGLFDLMSSMLANDDSKYYTLTENLTKQLDREYMYKFGINIGYNSCVVGAKKIREVKISKKIDVPWMIALNYESGKKLVADRIDKVISEGKELGVYFYSILLNSADVSSLSCIFDKFDDCAFALVMHDNSIDEKFIEENRHLKNVNLIVNSQNADFEKACDALRENKMLYSTYMRYDENTVFDDKIFDEIKNYTNTFFVMIPSRDTTLKKIKESGEFVKQARFKQNYAFIALDAVVDASFYNNILTNETRFLAYDSDGSAICNTEYKYEEKPNIIDNMLIDALKSV